MNIENHWTGYRWAKTVFFMASLALRQSLISVGVPNETRYTGD